jgi:hypothetical protein
VSRVACANTPPQHELHQRKSPKRLRNQKGKEKEKRYCYIRDHKGEKGRTKEKKNKENRHH